MNLHWTSAVEAAELIRDANGLPLGVQLLGPRHGDARLLRTARWLVARVGAGAIG